MTDPDQDRMNQQAREMLDLPEVKAALFRPLPRCAQLTEVRDKDGTLLGWRFYIAAPIPSPDALATERANTAALVEAAREMLNELPRERVEFGGIRTNETITRVHAALVPFAGIDPLAPEAKDVP